MIKKIVFGLISIVILATGYFAFGKLGYWERSVRIFSLSDNPSLGGGEGRRPGGFRGDERHEGFNGQRPAPGGMPDSIRARRREGDRQAMEPMDSITQRVGSNERGSEREDFNRGKMGHFGGRGMGDFHGGKNISLGNSGWFLAVFASSTVITIYLDKIICWHRKRKKKKLLGTICSQ